MLSSGERYAAEGNVSTMILPFSSRWSVFVGPLHAASHPPANNAANSPLTYVFFICLILVIYSVNLPAPWHSLYPPISASGTVARQRMPRYGQGRYKAPDRHHIRGTTTWGEDSPSRVHRHRSCFRRY